MFSFSELIQQGASHAWLFVPSPVLLGALHGLEPGHSKTMMAAFIIAVRGTVMQAVLLGLAATASHTAVVWAVALGGQYLGREWGTEATEPYFQIASAILIVGIAVWMLWRTWREHHADHDHHHEDETRQISTRGLLLNLEIYEIDSPPRWRLSALQGVLPESQQISLDTIRQDGGEQSFWFIRRDQYLESTEEIPEPHAFRVRFACDGEISDLVFTEHEHTHMNLGAEDDSHAREHTDDIRRKFEGRTVTTGQIIMFGLTGGLIPCPAAITVLLLCIQLKQISLGIVLVLSFSVGLALTMVVAGVAAAVSVNHIARRWSGFGEFARRAPYVSGGLIILVGLYTGLQGWIAL